MTNGDRRSSIPIPRWFVSPVAAAAAMIAVFILVGKPRSQSGSELEVGEIQKIFHSFPEEIVAVDGIWLQSRLVPVPTGQAKMLGRSAYLSREYVRLRTYPQVNAIVFMVYCADSRMMTGHHPPNCYPSSGWDLVEDGTTDFSVRRADERVIETTIYRFERQKNAGEELVIISGFFLEDGRFFSTLDTATRNGRSTLLGGGGLFQFQILLQSGHSSVDVELYGRELLSGIPNALFDEIISKRNSSERTLDSGGVS